VDGPNLFVGEHADGGMDGCYRNLLGHEKGPLKVRET